GKGRVSAAKQLSRVQVPHLQRGQVAMKLLAVPGVGFVANSVNVHRSDLVVVADWLESSVLFFNNSVSKMGMVQERPF
ncbi:MAG: hypothetical protein ACRC33_22185, partial [Gemmataceae bacterium]